MNCPLPQGKTGKHVIYNVWQRSDSPEAFYACIDVSFSGAVANPWQALGNLRAQQDLPAGATVTLRLFDAQGRDAQRHSLTLAQGNNGAKQWPLALAQKVNQDSTLVNVGVLDAYGAVSPVASSQDNQVYVRQAGYRFQVDIELPVEGGGEQPGGDGKVDFDYPQGLQQYDAGTVVRGADGKRYQCKPYPNSGWCKGWDPTTPRARAWPGRTPGPCCNALDCRPLRAAVVPPGTRRETANPRNGTVPGETLATCACSICRALLGWSDHQHGKPRMPFLSPPSNKPPPSSTRACRRRRRYAGHCYARHWVAKCG